MHPPADPYQAFAPFYDDFTHDHDYARWLAALEEAARAHGLSGRRALDMACGSGKSFLPLLERGYSVVGSDASAEMLRRAAEKAPGTRLVCGDMTKLGNLGEFDLVTCLGDSLNYLLTADALTAALRSARRNLAPGGIFVADLNSTMGYRTTWASTFCVEAEAAVFLWRGRASAELAPGARARTVIDVFERTTTDLWRRISSPHEQRHHPEARVRSLLARAGLECLGVYGQLIDGSLDPSGDELEHHKLVYVAARPR
ncbi:MAG TPA: methyltransferase domain-containing protein [Thermoleophilaceae bacterium]|jgi:SAM-dependent methyltransferase